MVLTYFIVFKLIDKRRFTEILLFGSLVAVTVGVVDTIASSFVLWSFTVRFFPIEPSVFLYDLTLAPLYYMLVYQYTSSWKQYFIWNTVAAGLMSFVFLPVLTFFKIYQIHNWSYFNNFLVLFVIGAIARFTTILVISMEHRRRENYEATSFVAAHPAMMKPMTETDE